MIATEVTNPGVWIVVVLAVSLLGLAVGAAAWERWTR